MANPNVEFYRGTTADLERLETKLNNKTVTIPEGSFFYTTDEHKLYSSDSNNTLHLVSGAGSSGNTYNLTFDFSKTTWNTVTLAGLDTSYPDSYFETVLLNTNDSVWMACLAEIADKDFIVDIRTPITDTSFNDWNQLVDILHYSAAEFQFIAASKINSKINVTIKVL